MGKSHFIPFRFPKDKKDYSKSDIGIDSRGIAGDLSKVIGDLQRSDGYFTTRTTTLNNHIDDDRATDH